MQFIVPCPNYVFDALIWTMCALEPRKSFRGLLAVMQAKISSVVSSRYFFMTGCSVKELQRQGWIALKAACMISPVSLNGFSSNTPFKHPSRIQFEEQSCTKPSTRRDPKCSDSDSWHAAHQITDTVERLRSSCCLRAFNKISEKSLPLSSSTVTVPQWT